VVVVSTICCCFVTQMFIYTKSFCRLCVLLKK